MVPFAGFVALAAGDTRGFLVGVVYTLGLAMATPSASNGRTRVAAWLGM